jgi:hypothetical protein
LEEFDRVNATIQERVHAIQSLAGTIIPAYQCPSTLDYPRTFEDSAIRTELDDPLQRTFAATDYADQAVILVDEVNGDHSTLKPGAWWGGPVPVSSFRNVGDATYWEAAIPSSFRNVQDGLSNTALVSEQAGLPWSYGNVSEASERETWGPPPGDWQDGVGTWFYFWRQLDFTSVTSRYVSSRQSPINGWNLYGLFSFHNGVNSVFCDGSVHFLSEDTDRLIVERLLTREGGEPGGLP